MSSEADSEALQGSHGRNGWRWTLLAVGLGLGLVGLGVWWSWPQAAAPEPPVVSLQGMDAPVAAMISQALERVRKDPRDGAAWGQLGQVLEIHDRQLNALDCFIQAERLDPTEPRWPYRRAYLLGHFQGPEQGLPHLRQAVALVAQRDPGNRVPRLRLAETLLQIGRLDEAGELLTQLLREDPASVRAHFLAGLLALTRNDFGPAEDHLARAAQSPKARKKVCAQLARLFQQQGKEPLAAEFSRRAATLPADQPWYDPYEAEYARLDRTYMTQYQKTKLLEAQGQKEELLLALHELNRDFPNNHSALALATTLTRMGEWTQAEAIFRRALEQADLQIPAHCSLGIGLYEQGRRRWDTPEQRAQARAQVQEAVEHLNVVRQRKPDSAVAHLFHGQALQLLGQSREALRSYRLCIECRPEWPDGHLRLGELLAELGETGEACRALELAAQLSPPNDSRARRALDQVHARKKP